MEGKPDNDKPNKYEFGKQMVRYSTTEVHQLYARTSEAC
jgi:hypothetical protein